MVQKVRASAQGLRLHTMLRELGARIVEPPSGTNTEKSGAESGDPIAKSDGQTAKSDGQTAKSDGPTATHDAATAAHDAAIAAHDAAIAAHDAANATHDAAIAAHDAATATHDNRPLAITVGELVDKAAHSGFGFLIAVLALVAIPFFGLSTPFGLGIALVGFQLVIGRERPWLPKRARKRRLKMTMLDRILGMVNKRMRWLAASTRRRWQPMVRPRLVGFGVVLLGLGLALPLPIPGSNIIFIVPVLIYAIGLLEGDGMWIVVGHLATLVDLALLVIFGATVVTVMSSAWSYVF